MFFFTAEEVTRNYLPRFEEPLIRDCSLLPWFPDKLSDKEWIKQLSAETTLESTRNKLKEIQIKVCIFFFLDVKACVPKGLCAQTVNT